MVTIKEIKAEAVAYRRERKAAGRLIKHSEALEWAAKKHGFENWRACRATLSAVQSPANSPAAGLGLAEGVKAEPKEDEKYAAYQVKRTKDVPLRFQGRIIGTVEFRDLPNNDQYARATIYVTKRGKYVGEKVHDSSDRAIAEREADVFDDALSLIGWFREEDGTIGSLANRALAQAASVVPAFSVGYGEDIE